jgi:uncharacterized protein (DUF302 family)
MPTDANEAERLELLSDFDFEQTLARVTNAIEGAGMKLFAVVDHAAGAAEVGLSMPPTTLLIYGHAKGGTPIMQAAPMAALDLPLHALVRADADGRAFVAFHPIVQTLTRAGVPEALASRLAPAQRLLVEAIAVR